MPASPKVRGVYGMTAYAVPWTDSDFDYRVFPNLHEAESFIARLPLEEGDEEPPIVELAEPTPLPDAIREAISEGIRYAKAAPLNRVVSTRPEDCIDKETVLAQLTAALALLGEV